MDFTDIPRRPRGESIVPMINVVFLLLIFFLMTSSLIQPEPFEVSPPTAGSEVEPISEKMAYLDKTGRLHFDGSENEAAYSSLASLSSQSPRIQLYADAEIEAKTLARILRKLSETGLSKVELVVMSK